MRKEETLMREEMITKVKELIEAGSCCAEAKAAGMAYLTALGTDQEKAAAAALITELSEDVNSGEHALGFFGSDRAKQIFGEEGAANMLEAQKASIASGNKYCICAACQAGGAILDAKDAFLA